MSSTIFYGCLGAGLALYSNAVRKLPLMRKPWEHVIYFGVGAFLGSKVEGFKESKKAELAQVRAEQAALTAAREARIAAKKAAAAEAAVKEAGAEA